MLPTSGLADHSTIVGRERELASLSAVLDRAIARHGTLVLVSGEAGIGKTTLATELLRIAAAQGCLLLAGGCYDLTTTPPYGPWIEIVNSYPADDSLPPLPEQLRAGGGMSGIDSQMALFDLTLRFLADVAQVRPLMLALEDLHWADPASLDLLRYLARRLHNQPVLLLATYRDDELTRQHPLAPLLPTLVRESQAQRVELPRLERHALQLLVAQRYRLSEDDGEQLVAYLFERAEGNPFFSKELLHTLEAQRLLQPVAGGWQLADLNQAGVPALILQVIDGRLTRLDSTCRRLLEDIAVVGYEAPLNLLRQLSVNAPSELDTTLQQLQEHHLLLLDPGRRSVRFSHALVRQAIYSAIPPIRRESLHRQVGELLARAPRPDPSAVARHFYEAGDERGLDWLTRAAEHAESLFAPEAVIAECDRAFELADRLGTEAPLPIYRLRGRARESVGDFNGALADLERLLELARRTGAGQVEWQTLLDLGMLWASRDYGRTRAYCEQAAALARGMDHPAALGHSLNRLGNWHLNAEQPADALRYHHEALEIFESINDQQGVASTLDLTATVLLMSSSAAQAVRYYARAIPLLRLNNDQQTLASALVNITISCWGEWIAPCLRIQNLPPTLTSTYPSLIDEAAGIARESGWRAGETYALGAIGLRAVNFGSVRAGLQQLKDALSIAEDIQHHLWIADAHLRIGCAYASLLLSDRAQTHLRQAVDTAAQVGSSIFETGAIALLASTHIQTEDYAAAERLLQPEFDLDAHPSMASTRLGWLVYGELRLAQHRPADALEIIDALVRSIPEEPGFLSPDLLRLRGEALLACADLSDAERQLMEARAIAVAFGHPHGLWRIHAALRRVHVAQGRLTEAHAAGEAALTIINDLADQLDDDELRITFRRRALAQVDMTANATDAATAGTAFGGLTSREREVLVLLVEGLSNREIAGRLSVSHRTVMNHVSNILGKLGVTSRTAAATVALREGLIPPA